MIVNDINVTVNGLSDITPHEVENYIAYIEGQTHEKLDRLSITGTDDGRVTLGYEMRQPKFERVRRITGYLVGTTDRWNNAKQAEEHERVKHGLHWDPHLRDRAGLHRGWRGHTADRLYTGLPTPLSRLS